jgi:hypothetical protein
VTARNDADLTDDEIWSVGEKLEARAREIRARGDSALRDGEVDELVGLIRTHDSKWNDDEARLRRWHRVQLREVAAGACDRAAGRMAGDMLARRTIARSAARQDSEASLAEVRRAIVDMRARGLPRRDAAETDQRQEMINRMTNNYGRGTGDEN